MKCPHCTIHFHENWEELPFIRNGQITHQGERERRLLALSYGSLTKMRERHHSYFGDAALRKFC
jgi:hypothetical protein